MKYIKLLALTLLLSLAATTAHAGEGSPSFLRCGLKFGGTSEPKHSDSYSRKHREYGSTQSVKSIEKDRPHVASFSAMEPARAERRRTPVTFTVARFVCAWR